MSAAVEVLPLEAARERKAREIAEFGRSGRGQAQLLAHIHGKRLTPRAAILAWCYECQGWNEGGRTECAALLCPLRPYSQYNPEPVKSESRVAGIRNLKGKVKENDCAEVGFPETGRTTDPDQGPPDFALQTRAQHLRTAIPAPTPSPLGGGAAEKASA